MSDGGLRPLFRQYLPDLHWQSIETAVTGAGVPDSNYCRDGCEGWVEFKQTKAWAVQVAPAQVGWIERRIRAGGHVFVAVRRQSHGGPRTTPCDELYLYHGRAIRDLRVGGIKAATAALILTNAGGPSNWNWGLVRQSLLAH